MSRAEPGNAARSLASLVAYQNGSVVSHALFSRSAGTVTLFAFDADQGLSEHTTPHEALVFLVEGRLAVTIDGTPHQLDGDDDLLLPANRPHAVHSDERSKMLLVMFRH